MSQRATEKVVTSRDVVFEEEKGWNWGGMEERINEKPLLWEENESEVNGEELNMELHVLQVERQEETAAQEIPENSPLTRIWRPPSYLQEYETGKLLSEEEEEEEEEEEDIADFAMFASLADPVTFDVAKRDDKWINAMETELESVEKNGTWFLTELPKGAKKIGVKWVYKTKLNERGEVDKYKARLVAKDYAQPEAQEDWCVYQLDVKSAFLHGELSEDVYVKLTKVYKLTKTLNGLKQAPHACLYVDDLIFTGNDESLLERFKSSMKKEFDMTDLGKMKYFLGKKSDCAWNEIVKRGRWEQSGSDIVQAAYWESNVYHIDKAGYDVYTVCLLSMYMADPHDQHLQAAKRVLQYLKDTLNFGVFYKRGAVGELTVYTDSEYAGDIDDRRSTSGYAFLLSGGVVAWASFKKQPVVTLFTTEAEFVAAFHCACQCVWMRRILEEFGLRQSRSTTIMCDNSSAIKLSKNPVLHGRSKYFDVRFHFLRDLTKDGVVNLVHCGTNEHVADILTKPLRLEVFIRLREKLGVCGKIN
ncbi:Reverse transcriptase RNA-dependent DNA polymerase [Arabidopsis thaliana x Arabidopsis arenosa]|uniref:Reverse transcriptase RNA-dependent DNA polymerase n=1 Tax=Arabidopsis thaliana x Arabidopsis arenosa TaxID=1240361 RepID=A0A8T2AZ87_9BRAS|nr:Reverse transcriptase RNA-dependent DNA polymerase [Arabidopsis thaliana x Arabidopsis arenosa]